MNIEIDKFLDETNEINENISNFKDYILKCFDLYKGLYNESWRKEFEDVHSIEFFVSGFICVEQLNQIPKGEWFCRSNSGNKLLRGQLLTNETIHYIYKNLNTKNVIYISKWKELDGEMRFWCINGKIADYSSYCTFGKDSKYYGDLDLLRAVDYVHHLTHSPS